jgi:hypothetical protein
MAWNSVVNSARAPLKMISVSSTAGLGRLADTHTSHLRQDGRRKCQVPPHLALGDWPHLALGVWPHLALGVWPHLELGLAIFGAWFGKRDKGDALRVAIDENILANYTGGSYWERRSAPAIGNVGVHQLLGT